MSSLEVPSVDALQAKKLLDGGAILLDVRTEEEWHAGHAPEAIHMELMSIPAQFEQLPGDGDVVVVCKAGGRSFQAASYLRQRGVTAINLDGGMLHWADVGLPVVSSAAEAGYVS